MGQVIRAAPALLGAVLVVLPAPAQVSGPYFRIDCVDAVTGRGVPLVELRTTGSIPYVSDSNGIVAFHEPGLMGHETYLHVSSHGYSLAPDGFGNRGVRLTPVAGESARVELERHNVAQRLYRVTGGGLYRDSWLVGAPVPLREPLLGGGVIGQDSVMAIPYRGLLRWFWGDTARAAYPLGNFAVSGATSELPGRGGLEPDVGVDLSYLVDERGFSRPMCPLPGAGPKWIDGTLLVPDPDGRERLVAHYVRVKSLGDVRERGLVIFDDDEQVFEKLVQLDLAAPLHPHGHPLQVTFGGERYHVFGRPFPAVRVRNDLAAVQDPARYEAFTCLALGARSAGPEAELDEGARYGWKRDTAAVHAIEQERLVSAGRLAAGDAWLHLRDVQSGAPVRAHGGSVYWNDYRQRWIAIVLEVGGSSYLGEIWYAEGDTLLGPWVYARKIVTHDDYSFYNPAHHPWFDRDGGRLIHFEGTYTAMFSGSTTKTPRYDYNQIMYRLALDDPRAVLPVPVYRLQDGSLATRSRVAAEHAWQRVEAIPFFAADRRRPGLVAIGNVGWGLALDAQGAEDAENTDVTVPIYRGADGELSLERRPGAQPLARVWRNPMQRLILAPDARPVR